MLENSYDAKGLKFGIVASEYWSTYKKCIEERSSNEYYKQYVNELLKSDLQIIDFDDVDGLTLEELRETAAKMLPEDRIIFLMYNSAEWSSRNRDTISITPKHLMVIKCDEDKKHQSIDWLVADSILSSYHSMDPAVKKYARCFLQRYRYGTKAETDKNIRQYIYTNHKPNNN